MSNQINTELLELAAEHIDYWAGEGIGKVLEKDLADNNLEKLHSDVLESARLIHEFEYQNDDPMTDERAEDMFLGANDVY